MDMNIVYTVVAGILTLGITTALYYLRLLIKSKMSNEKIEAWQIAATIAVGAVEKIAANAGYTHEVLYEMAVDFFKSIVKDTLTEEQIKALIESALIEAEQWWKELPKANEVTTASQFVKQMNGTFKVTLKKVSAKKDTQKIIDVMAKNKSDAMNKASKLYPDWSITNIASIKNGK